MHVFLWKLACDLLFSGNQEKKRPCPIFMSLLTGSPQTTSGRNCWFKLWSVQGPGVFDIGAPTTIADGGIVTWLKPMNRMTTQNY